jgi:hypothetical protein
MTTGMLRVRGWFFSRSVAVVPRHVWHGEVHDDHVRPRGERQLDALRPIGGSDDAEAPVAQVLGVHLAHIQRVVHKKNEAYATRTPCRARTMPRHRWWRSLRRLVMRVRGRPRWIALGFRPSGRHDNIHDHDAPPCGAGSTGGCRPQDVRRRPHGAGMQVVQDRAGGGCSSCGLVLSRRDDDAN